jgi:decaprenylphospho-beta-D-erythro-pentofuranosid-2-ulose 2-reductase
MKNPQTIWSVGATSRIGLEMQRLWAPNATFHLCARNPEKLQRVCRDLQCRGAHSTETHPLETPAQLEKFDLLLICLGSLSEQGLWQTDSNYRQKEWQLNTLTILDWIEWGAASIEQHRQGHLAVMTSVAADRPKKSNYAYGSAKAALDFYLLGLEHRLHPLGLGPCVHILKPGPTQSPMTTHLQNKKLADPKEVARELCQGLSKNQSLIYAPKIWSVLMRVIKLCPKALWMKTNL